MGKDTRINVTLDFNADLKNIQGAVGNIQKSLQGLSLPQGLNKNFLSLFSNLEAEVKNFGSLTSKELTTAGDFSAVEKSGKKILDLYRKLGVEIDSLSDTDKMKLFPPNTIADINKITNAMKQFNSATDKNKGAIAKAKENVAEYTAKLETQQKKMATLSNKTVLKNEDYKAAKEELEEQRKAVEQLAQAYAEAEAESKQRMESSGRTTEDKRTKQYKEKIKIQAELTEAQNKLNKAEQDFGNSISQSQYNSQMTKAQENTRKLELQLEQAAEELKNLGDGGAAEAFKKMMDSLKGIDGIDPSSIKSFEDLEQALQNIKNKAGADVDEKIEEIIAAMRAAQGPADQFGDNMREAGDSIKEMSREAQDLENLKHRILDFFSISNAVQLFKRAVNSAFDTVKELDATMTEAAVVTEFSVGDMWDKLPEYSSEASKLGATINDLYGATTLYYQQGLKTNEAMQLGTETMKMARIAGMDSAAATEAMTAALRGFNMELNETSATKVNDVYSELAAITAADTEQIATAMSKTASIAANANMEFESTAAFLSQIIETTQEAPETAGTALKTIIARFSEVKSLREKGLSSGEDSEGEIIDVNKIQGALRTVGISMDEFFAGTEGLDSVLLKLASKWETLDFETQRYIATTAAGSRQQSRFIAMMSNYDRTMELVGAANNSAGASQEQFNKTLESLDSKLNNLKNAWDEFVMGLANNELIKAGVDLLTGFLETVNKIISTISGGSGIVKTFITAFAAIKAFNIGKGLLGQVGLGEGGGLLGGLFGGKKQDTAGQTTKKNARNKGTKNGFFGGRKGGQKEGTEYGSGFIDALNNTTNKLIAKTNKNIQTNFQKIGKGVDFSDALSGLTKAEQNVLKNNKDFKTAYFASIDGLSKEQKALVSQTWDTSGIDAATSSVARMGGQVQLTDRMIGSLGDQQLQTLSKTDQLSNSLNKAGQIAGMAGGAMMMFAGILEKAGASDGVVKVVEGIGTALIVLSAILPIVGAAIKFTAKGGVKAFGQMAAAAWASLGPYAIIIAAILAIAAAFAILASAAQKNSLAGQMEAAAEKTEAARAAAEAAKNAYDELLSSRKEFNELQSQLDGLTKGTDAWKQALVEANSQVLSLLSTYPELAQYVVKGEHGQLSITEEGWDKKVDDQLNAVQNAQANVTTSQMNEVRLKSQAAEVRYREAFKDEAQTASMGSNYFYLNEGESISQGINAGEAFVYDKWQMDAIEELASKEFTEPGQFEAAAEELAKEFNNVEVVTPEMVNEIYEMTNAMNEYNAALATNNLQLQSQAESLLLARQSEETAAYEYGNNVVTGFAAQMTTDNYDKQVKNRASELYSKDGQSESQTNEKFKALAEEYGVASKMVGDDLKDLQTLYAEMAGIDISEIPENIKEDKKAMAQAIAEMDMSDEIAEKMEKFRAGMQKLATADQEKVAALVSGDASQMSVSELDEMQTFSTTDYAKKMGYEDEVDEQGNVTRTAEQVMASDQGYEDTKLSELDKEDQATYIEQNKDKILEGVTDSDLKNSDYWKTDEDGNYIKNENGNYVFDNDKYIEANKDNIDVSGVDQLKIDEQQRKEEWERTSTAAKTSIKSAVSDETAQTLDFGKDSALGVMSPEALKNLGGQLHGMGQENAEKYLSGFQNIINNSNLGEEETEQLANYLANVDWSNMTEATDALEYMQDLGIDSSIIEEYWNTAVDSAGAYIKTVNEAMSMQERFAGKIKSSNEALKRLEEGTGTAADLEMVKKAGVDIEGNFRMTADGYKLTGDAAEEAAEKVAAYNYEQGKLVGQQTREQLDHYSEVIDSTSIIGTQGPNSITTYDEETGEYVAGDFMGMSSHLKNNAAEQLGVHREEGESDEDYWARAEQAYIDYVNSVNNKEVILESVEQNEAMLAAEGKTVDQVQAEGGSELAQVYAVEGEASRLGIDVEEVNAYAESIRNSNDALTEARAAELALANAKMNAGLGEIIDSYDTWTGLIDKSSGLIKASSSQDAKAYSDLRKSVNKMLNTSEDLSESFWNSKKNMDNLKKAAEGDTEALEELQKAAASDYLQNLDLNLSGDDLAQAQSAIDDFTNYLEDVEIPKLEAGVQWDDSGSEEFINRFNDMSMAANLSAEQIQNSVKSMGFDAEIKYEEQTRKLPIYEQSEQRIDNGDGTATIRSGTPRITGYEEVTGYFPVVKTLTASGAGGGGVSSENAKGAKGGGGGGSDKPKKQHWENPHDKLYETQQKLDETLRERNQLEREYDRLLADRDTSAAKLLENQAKQLKNLQDEYKLQKKIAQQELKEITSKNAKKADYLATHKNGDEEEQVWTTFQDEATRLGMGNLDSWAKYNAETNEIEIDWEAIEALEDDTTAGEDKGSLIEAYISYLEENSDSYEEALDRLEEIEDEIREIQERGKQEYLDFEQRVYDALVAREQERIDDMQSLSDTLSEANSSILDSLQESIDLERQIRDNTKQEEDIADMEARLAYLRRDTSGANQQEILQLEEQLGDARESYSDSLIDQQLAKLSDENAKAEEQRQNQIDLAQAQLDYWTENGYFWPEVSTLIEDAAKAEDFSSTDLATVLAATDGFKGMSYFGKENWLQDAMDAFAVAIGEGKSYWMADEAKKTGTLKNGEVVNAKGKSVGTLTYDKESGKWVNEKTGTTWDILQWDEAQGKYVVSGYTAAPKEEEGGEEPTQEETETYPYGKASETSGIIKRGANGKKVQAIQYALNKLGYGNDGTKDHDGSFGKKTEIAVKSFQGAMGITKDGKVGDDTRAKFKLKKYKTGGIADFTGPAWLDGTKSKPEIILNQQDSKNFIMLKDVLAEILQGATSTKSGQKSGGDNYFDISIIVDEISSDYDVDQMAARIKQQIYEDSTYRNVNAINLIR